MTKPKSTQWFTEADLPGGTRGIRISVETKRTIFDERSDWGHIQVFDTYFYGSMLAIDGIIQVTEKDEFIYHEMMVTLPGLLYGTPRNILICGGGDGGALKQALRFDSLVRARQVEIDDVVSVVSRKYLPGVSGGAFEDARVELRYEDAYEHIAASSEMFDVIALDLTDPVPDSPAERLFSADFFEKVSHRLSRGGIMSLQCGALIFQQDEIRQMLAQARSVYKYVEFHSAVVPSYQLTSFGFIYASNEPIPTLTPQEFDSRSSVVNGEHRYLSHGMYVASSALPPYQQDLMHGIE
jgi:spermidine synthase